MCIRDRFKETFWACATTFNRSTSSAGIRNVLLTISGLLTLNIASPLGTSIDEKLRVKYTLFLHPYFYVQSIAMRQKMLYHVGMNSKKQGEGRIP